MGGNKFIITLLLVFVIVVQSSFAQKPTNSGPIESEVRYDLATIQFGEDGANQALQRASGLIFANMESVLNEEIYGPEYQASRTVANDEIIYEEMMTAFMLGIVPTLEATRTFQLDLEIEPRRNSSQATITNLVNSILRAIQLIRSDNYYEGRTGINREEKIVKAGALMLITGLFSGIINLNGLTSEDQELLQWYREKATSEIMNGVTTIFRAIKFALVQLSIIRAEGAGSIETCMSTLKDAQAEASAYFKAEVTYKYTAIRTVYLSQFLQRNGILQGLFAIQSAQGLCALQSVQTKPFPQLNYRKFG